MSDIKSYELLTAKLVHSNRFWSFDKDKNEFLSDDVLIEKTLIYLDIDDINLLFSLYSYKKIKQVWRSRVAVQGDFYARLNRFLAWMYFGIKNPDRYLKTIESKQLKKY
jgi:hypothetical protein